MKGNKLLLQKEFARRHGVTAGYISNMIAANKIRFEQVGSHKFVIDCKANEDFMNTKNRRKRVGDR